MITDLIEPPATDNCSLVTDHAACALLFHIPRVDLVRFTGLLPRARKLVERRLRAMKRIARAVAAGRTPRSECVAIANAMSGERGWGLCVLQNLWREFSTTGDWSVLVDASLAGPMWYSTLQTNHLPHAFLDHLASGWALHQRDKFASVFSDLKIRLIRWRAGDKTAAIPGYIEPPQDDPKTGLPPGWTEGNLWRATKPRVSKFARKSIQIGSKSASLLSPKIITTREGIEVGRYWIPDDSWNDFKIAAYGQTCRLLAFHYLDLASGCNACRGYKPALRDRERDTEERLREKEMVWLTVSLLTNEGYHPSGCTIICEKSTATIREREERILRDTMGDAIKIDRGPAGGGPGIAALFNGRSGGNPRWKAPLESWFNLLRNRTDSLLEFPGQTGSNSRINCPEGLPGLERDTLALMKVMRVLPPEKAELARLGLLTLTEAIFKLDAVTELINCRIDHDLKDWEACGHQITEWRLGAGLDCSIGQTGWASSAIQSPWHPEGDLLNYDPAELAAISALLANHRELKRTRDLSPREVYDAGKSRLVKLPPAVAGLLMDELPGTELPVRLGCITHEDADVDPEPMQFGLIRRDGRGTQDPLRNDEKYFCRLNAIDPSVLWLYDAHNRFVGVAPRYLGVRRDDEPAMRAAYKRKAQAMAPLAEEVRRLAAPYTQKVHDATRHNLAHVLGPVPRGTSSEPAPRPTQPDDCTQDLLAREHAATPAGESESWD